MTTATTWLPAARPFTPEECATSWPPRASSPRASRPPCWRASGSSAVDECLAMLEVEVLHEDDRIELIDGELLIMPPFGDNHEEHHRLAELSCVFIPLASRAMSAGTGVYPA